MLSPEQYQHVQTTMDDLAIEIRTIWIDARTLAERDGMAEVQRLVGPLLRCVSQARGVASVLRDEGVPR